MLHSVFERIRNKVGEFSVLTRKAMRHLRSESDLEIGYVFKQDSLDHHVEHVGVIDRCKRDRRTDRSFDRWKIRIQVIIADSGEHGVRGLLVADLDAFICQMLYELAVSKKRLGRHLGLKSVHKQIVRGFCTSLRGAPGTVEDYVIRFVQIVKFSWVRAEPEPQRAAS